MKLKKYIYICLIVCRYVIKRIVYFFFLDISRILSNSTLLLITHLRLEFIITEFIYSTLFQFFENLLNCSRFVFVYKDRLIEDLAVDLFVLILEEFTK